MAKLLVLGGGVCGLASAMLLAREGHEVTLLERDAQNVPESWDEAWDRWERRGVTQFRLPHYMHPRFRLLLEAELPDVLDALEAAGAARVDLIASLLPPFIEERAPRPGDDRFVAVTARRPVIEQVFARAAENEQGVTIRRGVKVTELVCGPSAITDVPHVAGVRTDAGEELDADLVVDAMGRRSPLPELLAAAGTRSPVDEEEDSGFAYYGRNFRSDDGGLPDFPTGLLTAVGSISLLTLPCDNGTWSVTVVTSSRDPALKGLRHADRFEAVMRAHPLHAHLVDAEPITEMQAIGGLIDRYRRYVVDDVPVATGVASVADAWACTNPSLGRGISLGLMHAVGLRDTVASSADDPEGFAHAWDTYTETELTPWYRGTLAVDRARIAEMEALREGREPPTSDDPQSRIREALFVAAPFDPDIFRGFLDIVCCLERPEQVIARPGFLDKVVEVAASTDPFEVPGPSRAELLELSS